MRTVDSAAVIGKFDDYCGKVSNESETVIITCKDEKSVVLINLEEYNHLRTASDNLDYFLKISRSMDQFEKGQVIEKTMAELEAME
jgi:antitoxin YefM